MADRSALVRTSGALDCGGTLESEAAQDWDGITTRMAPPAPDIATAIAPAGEDGEGVIEFAVPQVSDTAEPFRTAGTVS
ncbi:MAG: hypothetical protein ACXW2I_12100 [Burkholderiales bacterium]